MLNLETLCYETKCSMAVNITEGHENKALVFRMGPNIPHSSRGHHNP